MHIFHHLLLDSCICLVGGRLFTACFQGLRAAGVLQRKTRAVSIEVAAAHESPLIPCGHTAGSAPHLPVSYLVLESLLVFHLILKISKYCKSVHRCGENTKQTTELGTCSSRQWLQP